MVREAKDSQRRKLWAVTFTSEVFQTLVDDQTTVYLSSTPSNLVDVSSRAAAAKCALGAEVILDLILDRDCMRQRLCFFSRSLLSLIVESSVFDGSLERGEREGERAPCLIS